MPFENNKINETNYYHIVMSITTIKFMELGIINPKIICNVLSDYMNENYIFHIFSFPCDII